MISNAEMTMSATPMIVSTERSSIPLGRIRALALRALGTLAHR